MTNKNSRRSSQRMVPFLQNGISALINPEHIPDWKRYSGKTVNGVQVQSIEAAAIGDSILLRRSGGNTVLSVTKDELEVFTKQYQTDNGLVTQGARN